jgi:hypothetical protein
VDKQVIHLIGKTMPVGILYKRKSVKMDVKFFLSVLKNKAKGTCETPYILNLGKGVYEGIRDMGWGDSTTTLRHAVTPHSVLASSSGMLFSSEVQ